MDIQKKRAILLGLGLALINSSVSSALTTQEISDYILNVYSERYVGSDRLKTYMSEKGFSLREYEAYLEELNKYNGSSELLWEKIENGSILIDEILFSDASVKKEYEKALKLLGSERLAYEMIKKNMASNPSKFVEIFESKMKDLDNIKMAFEKKFNREPNDLEYLFFENISDIKYALYCAVKNGHITQQQIESIEEDKGYEVFDLTDEEIETYSKFIKKREVYDDAMISYVKSYAMFDSIYIDVMSKYKKDIYVSLTDEERLNIYEKSLNGFVFNESTAKKKVISMLKSKKIITNEDLLEDGLVSQESSSGNPWQEAKKHLQKNSIAKNKVQLLESLYISQGMSSVFEGLDDKTISIRYNGKDIETYIRLSDDETLKGDLIGKLFEILENELGVKNIFSIGEVLSLFENKINKFELPFDDEKGIPFKELVRVFKQMGVTLYLKDINFDDSSVADVDEDVQGKSYKLVLNFKDKMVVFDMKNSKAIQIKEVAELLSTLGVKFIPSADSVILLTRGELIKSSVFGLRHEEILIEDLKKLLKDLNESVNIKVIKEDM